MGKYDAIMPSLKPLPVEDLAHQERVNQLKARVRVAKCPSPTCHHWALTTDETPICPVCYNPLVDSGEPVTPTWLAKGYRVLRAEKTQVEAQLSGVNTQLKAFEQLLADSQSEGHEGWGAYGVKDNALRLADGDTIRIDREPYGKVEDKEKFRLWCIANGYETKLQLWPTTMNTIVKERLVAGEPEPDGTAVYSYVKIVFTPMKEEK